MISPTEAEPGPAPSRDADYGAQDVIDALPLHIAVLDGDGVIREANRAWHRFARENKTDPEADSPQVAGVNYLAVCASAQGAFSAGAEQAYQGVLAVLRRREPSFHMEYPCHSPTRQRWFAMTVSPLDAPVGGAVVTHADITGRKQAEEALQASEARLRAVVEDQTEIISRLDASGTLLFVNEVFCRFFGKTGADLIGQRWHPAAHPDDVPVIEARLAELSPARPVVLIENRVFAGDGSLRWMQFVNRAFFGGDGTIREIQSVGRDISERRAIEVRQLALLEENTRMGRQMIRVQETERTELARELHDELSQQLAAIRAFAGAIRRGGGRDPAKLQADAAAVEDAASQIYAVSHRLMEGLRPQLLDSAGLVEALRAMLTTWSERHAGMRVVFRVGAQRCDIDAQTRIHLFRIAQESLANVALHARASAVRVFLGEVGRGDRRQLRLVIRDDGAGLGADTSRRGYGLIIMRERAQTLGGRLAVDSRPGCGVRLAVDVPRGGSGVAA